MENWQQLRMPILWIKIKRPDIYKKKGYNSFKKLKKKNAKRAVCISYSFLHDLTKNVLLQ